MYYIIFRGFKDIKGCTLTDLYQPVMYFLWAWCIFVMAPSFLSSTARILIFLRSIFWGTIAILFVGIIGSVVFNIPLSESTWANAIYFWFSTPRIYCNNNIFSYSYGLVITSFFFGTKREKHYVFCGDFWYYNALFNRLSYLGLVFLASIFFVALLKYPNPWYTFNKLSSGRLVVWVNKIWCNITTNPWSFIWGGEQATSRGVSRLSGEDASMITSVFGRYRLDSVYVDMFLMFGVIGLILFVFIFLWFLKSLLKKRRDLEMNYKKVYSFIIAVVIGILVASISASWIPSMGNLINISILPIILAIHYNRLFIS